MRTKSAYREKIVLPEKELPIEQPAEPVITAPPPVVPMGKPPEQPKEDAAKQEADLALKKELERLRQSEALNIQFQRERSEEIQRQQAAQVLPQQPVTREQKLALWKQGGLSDAEALFLERHPDMIDHPAITNMASVEAMRAGHERNSAPYWAAVELNFNNHLARLREQATTAPEPAMQPTPKFFEPPPKPKPKQNYIPISLIGERSIPSAELKQDLSPRSITLTAEEVQIAKASGISVEQYAKNKIKMLREKAEGLHQQ